MSEKIVVIKPMRQLKPQEYFIQLGRGRTDISERFGDIWLVSEFEFNGYQSSLADGSQNIPRIGRGNIMCVNRNYCMLPFNLNGCVEDFNVIVCEGFGDSLRL